jgi:lipid A 3-O-deacylase
MVPAAPADADEIFGGIYVHDVETPFTRSGQEDGIDLQLGWRGDRMAALGFIGAPSPHAYVLANTSGDTSFASGGFSWKIGGAVYLRPGIGIAIHDGPGRDETRPDRIRFGSRILFAPEVGAGAEIGEGVSIEASWVHFSHARLFGDQNPGTDNFGLRLNYRF